MQRRCAHAVFACCLAMAAAATAHATPLDEEACTQLKQELQTLESRGARTDMINGPDWAKTNLDKNKLAQIKSLIEIEEALAFRCPQPKAKPKSERAEKAAPVAGTAAKADAAATPKAATARTRAQPKDESSTDEARLRQQTKTKAKPKTDDSYRPPAPRRETSVTSKPKTDSAEAGKATPSRPKPPAKSAATPPEAPFRNPFNSPY